METSVSEIFDITIIGGGPTGLFGAFYAGMRNVRTKIIDSLPQLGGQLSALYPEKYIYDVAGFPKILAKDLVRNLEDQALQFHPAVCLDEKVIDLQRNGDGILVLTTEPGRIHLTRTVMIAAGVGAFVPRKLDIPDFDRLEGRGVYYFVKNLQAFQGDDVLIVGGGDSAVDWALTLEHIAKHVTLIHRRDQFRAHEESVKQLMISGVEVKVFYELKAIRGEERVESVVIFDNRTREEEERRIDVLLLNIGFLANLGPIKSWGLGIEGNGIRVNSQMETNIPGVYAAGDIADYPGKLKLIATGVGEAAVAVNNAKHYIDPSAKIFPGHSSDMNIR
ncbi:MAG: NAD(P)/FAD-dependent oxidoreductase [Candidatus Latescibacteria bacterium]|nr:NAD(P)/FAD-dependent oxidoreductase [Candidatus Latescibacterota bacterium]